MIKPVGTPFDDPFAGIPEGVEKPEDEDADVFPPGEETFSLNEFETEYEVEEEEDLTGLWREYYFGLLWQGECLGCEAPKGPCSYRMLILEKE